MTGDETADGDGPTPRLSVSEDDEFVEPVDAKRLDAKTLAESEPEDGGFAALALMGGGSALLAGMVAMGRLLKAPG